MNIKKKIHKLNTIEDIANVLTEENYLCLMLDLASAFKYCLEVKKRNDKFKLKFIEWKDDNKVEMRHVKLIDTDGKQISKIKIHY